MIDQTFSRGASIRELDETENTCSDAKGGSRELDIFECDGGVLGSKSTVVVDGFSRNREDKQIVDA